MNEQSRGSHPRPDSRSQTDSPGAGVADETIEVSGVISGVEEPSEWVKWRSRHCIDLSAKRSWT